MNEELISVLRDSKNNANAIRRFFLSKSHFLNHLDKDAKMYAEIINDNSTALIDRIDNLLVTFKNNYDPNKIKIHDVIECVCTFYSITKEQLISKTNKTEIVFPRQMVMYICNKVIKPKYTAAFICRTLGGTARTTAVHSCKRIKNDIDTYPKRKAEYNSIMKMISTIY